MFQSNIHEGGHVTFPAFAGEKHYMVPVFKQHPLPPRLSHWQPTVDAMLRGVDTERPIFLMIDQATVKAGETHRRAGLHVDGYWHPGVKAHGGGHLGHRHPPGHRGYGGHGGSHMKGGWEDVDFSEPELVVLASDVRGCTAYCGGYDTKLLREGGDASSVPTEALTPVQLMDHRVYAGDVGTLHESVPLLRDTERTLVRLNCPGAKLH
jgi:hypothetical protein